MKNKWFNIKMFLLIFIVILLVACGNNTPDINDTNSNVNNNQSKENLSQNQVQELNIGYSEQPTTLDMHINVAQSIADIAGNIFEGLIAYNSKLEIEPMLADSWDIDYEKAIITFYLKQGVLFHNGEEMTANDVLASLNRWKEKTSDGNQYFSGSEFEKEDEYTIKLNINEDISPNFLLTILAFKDGNLAAIMPEDIINKADNSTGVKEFIGTGPFKFEDWQQDSHIHLVKFEDYSSRNEPSDAEAGEKKALVDDIYIRFVKDASTRTAGVISGEYDIASSIQVDDLGQLESSPNVELSVHNGGNLDFYFNKKKGIFSDNNARKAVVAGIDNEAILANAYGDKDYFLLSHNLMLESQSDRWSSDYGSDIYNQKDLGKAKELLSKTNYDGEEISILTYREREDVYRSSVVLQEELKKIGFNTKINLVERSTYDQLRLDEDGYDLFVVPGTRKPEPTSYAYLEPDNDFGWTSSPELNKIIKDFYIGTEEESVELYDTLQEWFWDYLPIVNVGEWRQIDAYNKNVNGYEYNEAMQLWNVSVSQ